ncbi:phosphate signaling complex protein PhoU [Botrimarina sp.]|uniref:phosphate signaling complex protein PhoU n=1 Tax=Botrimarina sp. TaxID=2795802 RepID=UPI0032EE7DBC
MSIHLERDLESLEQDLLAQSSLVEEMIRMACRGLVERRRGLLEELLRHEPEINRREVLIEEECLKILALHQPVAVDLRRVTMVLKANGDLERIADLAVNLGERNDAIASFPQLELPDFLERMAEVAIGMVRDSLDAFVELDADAARRVRRQDDEVDHLNRRLIELVYEVVRESPHLIEPALHLFSASRHIERMADHATNIAEDVIYLVEGEIARHRHDPLPSPPPGSPPL